MNLRNRLIFRAANEADAVQAADFTGIRPNFQIAKAWMAREFLKQNSAKTRSAFAEALQGIELAHEPQVEFKQRVPHAIGLVRTGDTTQYANVILESA